MLKDIINTYVELVKSASSSEVRHMITENFHDTLRQQNNPQKEINNIFKRVSSAGFVEPNIHLSLWIRAAYSHPHEMYNESLGHLLCFQSEVDFDGILDILEEIGTADSFSSICNAYSHECIWFNNLNSVEKSLDILYQISEDKCTYFIGTLQGHEHPIVNDVAHRYYKILLGEEE